MCLPTLCHKIICFSFRVQKRNIHLYICCLHKHGFTICTLETINNILKNALRAVITSRLSAHLHGTACLYVHVCVCMRVQYLCVWERKSRMVVRGRLGNGVWRRPDVFCIEQLPCVNPHWALSTL